MNDILIQKITMRNFMSHRNFELSLPTAGITVITGASGAGKSSIIDAVHWCLYGQTFREEGLPAGKNQAAATVVNISAKNLYAERSLDRGKSKFKWGASQQSATEYVTPTAGTNAFVATYGDSEAWAIRNVMTSGDLTFFTKGRDSDRKRFLEAMLNFQVFDIPFDKLSEEYREQAKYISSLKSKQEVLAGKIEELENHSQAIPEATLPEKPKYSLNEARGMVKQVQAAEDKLSEVKNDLHTKRHTLATYDEWLHVLGGGKCPTCWQAVPPTLVAEYRAKADALRNSVRELSDHFRQEHARLSAELSKWRAEVDAAQEYEHAMRTWKSASERASQHAEMIARRIEDFRDQLDDAILQAAVASDHATHVKACADAVSTKGVRAWALSSALSEVSRFTQRYLGLLDSPFSVEIKPTRTLSSGKVVDEIDFHVVGAGNGKFNAASEGERQRIAFAVRMAISSLYGGAGTIFLDEVFAHLDDSHIDGFCNLIREVATHRNVVVITHDRTFAKALGGQHVHL